MSTDTSSHVGSTQFLTVPQAARLLAVHPSTIRRWIQDGRLRAYRIGEKAVRVTLTDVLDLATAVRESPVKEECATPADQLGIHRLTVKERDDALAASEAARTFRERLREQYGDSVPQGWELLHEAREIRTEQLMRASEP